MFEKNYLFQILYFKGFTNEPGMYALVDSVALINFSTVFEGDFIW